MSERREKVVIVGSGNWGSAIARIAAQNVLRYPQKFEPEVTMWVHEEEVDGRPLSELINTTHVNKRYLPGIHLGDNVVAKPDLNEAIKDATAFIMVLPHQFMPKILQEMKGKVKADAKAVTLIKGVDVRNDTIRTFASLIQAELGISTSALSGANIALEVAQDHFCESTLGVPSPQGFKGEVEQLPDAQLWKPLFHTKSFRIGVVPDVEGVSLCGALKNIVAIAAGLIDGLEWGSNSKSAIMRIGMEEIKDFCLEYFPGTRAETFLEESCGIADIVTSCIGGRNRHIAELMVKQNKTFQELEESVLKGQKLQGPETALTIHKFIEARGTTRTERGSNGGEKTGYPLFEGVYKVCYQGLSPEKLVEDL